MLFNSLHFAIFLPIVFILYWKIPSKYRWILLLVSSYYFYMSWNVKYVILILFTTIISYTCALLLERTNDKKMKKVYLSLTLVVSLGILFIFKYFNFFSSIICQMLSSMSIPIHPMTLNLLLPVGISFYTFQTLSYVIDVYKGKVKAEHHFGVYATFISFFPQLVAGPIERTSNLLPQIKGEHSFQYEKASYGIKLMAWGFFKKMVIADTLAIYVDRIYGDLSQYKGFPLVVAILFFTLQIYCDFSGYSDIAIGTAKLFDIDLMENFKSPYFSASIKEFWNRWHISLSTWFGDYVYIPLGGNRCSKIRHYFNLLVTFLVSGLWHGANITFIVWGGIHGLIRTGEEILGNKDKKAVGFKRIIKIVAVFLFCDIAWVFFRATSLQDAFYVLRNALIGIHNPIAYLAEGLKILEMDRFTILYLGLMIILLGIYDWLAVRCDVITMISKKNRYIRWGIYISLLVIVILFSQKGEAAEFVYFQF